MKRSDLTTMIGLLELEYRRTLESLGPKLCPPKKRGDLIAGFSDGLRSMWDELNTKGILPIEED